MTDNSGAMVLYDGECSLCTGSVRRFGPLLRYAGFGIAPLQVARPGEPLNEMLVVTPDGRTHGGADGLVEIARRIWWAWPLFALAHLPGAMPLLRYGYRKLVENRHCLGGACRMTSRKLPGAWVPLVVLPAITLCFYNALPAWIFMWSLAFSIFIACRWLTFALAMRHGARPSSFRSAGYLLAWVGMDAKAFLTMNRIMTPSAPASDPLPFLVNRGEGLDTSEILFAFTKILIGVLLVWCCARFALPTAPLLAGWLGMIGIVFILHFGLFHLLSIGWRKLGVNAPPIMRAPLLSRSLAEFWGRRWNTAFHELVHRFTFRPTSRAFGVTTATLLVFFLSGLIHDLLLSLPARGGYGLPTLYFLLQGLGVLAEHSRVGRKIGLGRGPLGWLFTVTLTAGPAFWLFHPPFIKNVILPMLHAIGAT